MNWLNQTVTLVFFEILPLHFFGFPKIISLEFI